MRRLRRLCWRPGEIRIELEARLLDEMGACGQIGRSSWTLTRYLARLLDVLLLCVTTWLFRRLQLVVLCRPLLMSLCLYGVPLPSDAPGCIVTSEPS